MVFLPAARASLLLVTPDFPPAHGGIQLLMGRLAPVPVDVVSRGADRIVVQLPVTDSPRVLRVDD